MSTNDAYVGAVATTDLLVSLPAFHGIVWACFALCTIALSIRIYIRYACFHRLLVDDCLMIVSLGTFLAATIENQLHLKYIYTLVNVSNGKELPTEHFLTDIQKGLRSFGTAIILIYIGIWLIKLNFLFFFRRLGAQVTSYVIFWWLVLGFTIACGAVSFGVVQYHCLFGPVEDIITVCSMPSVVRQTYTYFKVSCIVDVVSDALILCFPISILWKIRISIRKKITLSAVFSLVIFTMAVTIVRGSIFGGVYKSIDEDNMREMNVAWIWFWFSIEFTVAFIIACIVSFRALFAQKEKKAEERERESRERKYREAQGVVDIGNNSIGRRARQIHDSLLDTLRSTERGEDTLDITALATPTPRLSLEIVREEIARDRQNSDTTLQNSNSGSVDYTYSVEATNKV